MHEAVVPHQVGAKHLRGQVGAAPVHRQADRDEDAGDRGRYEEARGWCALWRSVFDADRHHQRNCHSPRVVDQPRMHSERAATSGSVER